MTFAIIACLVCAAGLTADHLGTMAALEKGAREKNGIARYILGRANALWLVAFNVVVLGAAAWALCAFLSPTMAVGYLFFVGLIKLYFGWKNYRLARSL
jgi:hypothetical protein